VQNALTFDLEDWRQLVRWKMTGISTTPEQAVVRETEAILSLLAERGVTATFFVLANVARAYPDLVRRVHAAGHEVASHGLSHRLVHTQPAGEFRDETLRAKVLLEDVVGAPVLGYRAAEFSLPAAGPRALETLAEAGFLYDSSFDPARARSRGNGDMSPRLIETPSGRIAEFPVLAADRRGGWRRVGGGGAFHFLPTKTVLDAVKGANVSGRPAVLYLHPYDLPGERLAIAGPRTTRGRIVHARHAAVHNTGRPRVLRTLGALLDAFEFKTLQDLAMAFIR
jgi:polysaccharide deacetylase family protein (PEP-CTERM system associated)